MKLYTAYVNNEHQCVDVNQTCHCYSIFPCILDKGDISKISLTYH
jgi:hypothetical protein